MLGGNDKEGKREGQPVLSATYLRTMAVGVATAVAVGLGARGDNAATSMAMCRCSECAMCACDSGSAIRAGSSCRECEHDNEANALGSRDKPTT
jgi:hypothetical protein